MDEPCDVALLIPSWSPLKDWRDRTHLYVHQRPLATAPGSRVWLVKDRRLVHSYRIEGFVDLEKVLPGEADNEAETGWAMAVSDGRRANRDLDAIPDPHGVVTRWMQGFRYMRPDATEFVRAPRRPRPAAVKDAPDPALEEVSPIEEQAPEPRVERPWAGRLARLLGRKD